MLPLGHSWYGVSSLFWSAQACRGFLVTCFMRLQMSNVKYSGEDRLLRLSSSLWRTPHLVFLTPNGGYFWPRLGLVYTWSCSQLLVSILKLSQSVSRENYHITYMTSHTYTAQKTKLCGDVSHGSYSCITQQVQFKNWHLFSSQRKW